MHGAFVWAHRTLHRRNPRFLALQCWFFGRDLYKSLSPARPLGLIETNVVRRLQRPAAGVCSLSSTGLAQNSQVGPAVGLEIPSTN
jgi:hypothetical protein